MPAGTVCCLASKCKGNTFDVLESAGHGLPRRQEMPGCLWHDHRQRAAWPQGGPVGKALATTMPPCKLSPPSWPMCQFAKPPALARVSRRTLRQNPKLRQRSDFTPCWQQLLQACRKRPTPPRCRPAVRRCREPHKFLPAHRHQPPRQCRQHQTPQRCRQHKARSRRRRSRRKQLWLSLQSRRPRPNLPRPPRRPGIKRPSRQPPPLRRRLPVCRLPVWCYQGRKSPRRPLRQRPSARHPPPARTRRRIRNPPAP